MFYKMLGAFAVSLVLLVSAQVWAFSIPDGELDRRHIYTGNPAEFSSPAEVDYNAVVHETSEYAKIVDEKLEKGSGKYWILLSQASDRALNAISKAASSGDYDLIAEKGYLGSLEAPVSCPDITDAVIEQLD
mgnify:CR=1 FL=1